MKINPAPLCRVGTWDWAYDCGLFDATYGHRIGYEQIVEFVDTHDVTPAQEFELFQAYEKAQ